MIFEPVRTAVIGVGDISTVYLNAIDRSPALQLAAVASRDAEKAAAVGQRYGVRGDTVQAVLDDGSIELVVNLTPALEHDRLNGQIIEAGKNLYSEKPFSLSLKVAEGLARSAAERGVTIGTAPDTFFGAAHQAARRLLDEGAIGRSVFGLSFVGLPGIEYFHPNPAAFYQPGGEPPFDVGPYYLTQWINLLGPIRKVYATCAGGSETREVRRGPRAGTRFAVEVPTTFNAVLSFDRANVSLILSLDTVHLTSRPNEIFGSDGSIALADPIFFGGTPVLFKGGGASEPIETGDAPFGRSNRLDHAQRRTADYRGAGLVDLAIALRTGKPHRTGPDLIVHVVEAMEAIVRSGREGHEIALRSTCARPEPIDPVADRLLIDMCRSPFND